MVQLDSMGRDCHYYTALFDFSPMQIAGSRDTVPQAVQPFFGSHLLLQRNLIFSNYEGHDTLATSSYC